LSGADRVNWHDHFCDYPPVPVALGRIEVLLRAMLRQKPDIIQKAVPHAELPALAAKRDSPDIPEVLDSDPRVNMMLGG